MPYNRELDALIAERVMGLEVVKNKKGGWSIGPADYYDSYGEMIMYNRLPNYSYDIAAAWEVVEKLRNKTTAVSLATLWDQSLDKMQWIAKVEFWGTDKFEFAVADEAPEAIALVSLKAMEVKNG